MKNNSLRFAAVFLVGVVLVIPPRATAQGNGNGNGRPKAPKAGTATPSPSAPSPSAPSPSAPTASSPPPSPTAPSSPTPQIAAPVDLTGAVTFRQFGSWLDDASAAAPGEGYMSIGIGHWRFPGGSQTNVPMIGAGVGVADRIQVSASVPFYNVRYDGGTARGLDDVYFAAKYTLVDPTLTISEFGAAISPVVEVLSSGAPGGRVHFALPVSVELRRAPFRLYGSAGYFTRGSVFTGGALEWTAPSRMVFTGVLTQSYSVKEDPVLDGLLVGRRRADVVGSAAYPLGAATAAYASVGRSLTSPEGSDTSLALSGGVSFRFAR